jgi:hypothetical protein
VAKKSKSRSDAEKKFMYQTQVIELPEPDTEVLFSNDRKWRFDFAWTELMLAVEIEGGTWSGGRHIRPKGFQDDCVKYNEATLMGWRVFRYPTTLINNGFAIKQVEKAYEILYQAMME